MIITTDKSPRQITLAAYKKAIADMWRQKISNVNVTMRNVNISV